MFKNADGSERFDQSVRINTHEPASMRPCFDSQPSTNFGVRRKSGLAATSFETSITLAGAMNRSTEIVSVALRSKSFPVTQWIGASKCVPVCSPQEKLFQYHAGPRLSYLEISSSRNGHDFPNSGGS